MCLPRLDGLTDERRRRVFRSSRKADLLSEYVDEEEYESLDETEGLRRLFLLDSSRGGGGGDALVRFGDPFRERLVEMVETEVDEAECEREEPSRTARCRPRSASRFASCSSAMPTLYSA